MRVDYHVHLEHGEYEEGWLAGFLASARQRNLDEVGIAEHSHGFREFKDLYYESLQLDDSPVGRYQQQWLGGRRFRHSLDEYAEFMFQMKQKGYPVKMGLEVCNLTDQEKVGEILKQYPLDYVIGSVHFLNGWGFDMSGLTFMWKEYSLESIYSWYADEAECLCRSRNYDILGHPFNIRLYRHFPDFSVLPFLQRVGRAMKENGLVVDVNTGTMYRYPIKEISPYPAFMEVASELRLPVIHSSDAHQPEDCGRYIDEGIAYGKRFGYKGTATFEKRIMKKVEVI